MEQNNKKLGGILLAVGWVLCILVIGSLYHKWLYSAKEPKIIINQSAVKVIIEKNHSGHYCLLGRIANQTLEFMLDTGATKVSISENLAKKLGLTFGSSIQLNTANGEAEGYATKIPSLTIGPIEFNDVSAIIMPNLDSQALLGMNILKKFAISQQGDDLVLSYPKQD